MLVDINRVYSIGDVAVARIAEAICTLDCGEHRIDGSRGCITIYNVRRPVVVFGHSYASFVKPDFYVRRGLEFEACLVMELRARGVRMVSTEWLTRRDAYPYLVVQMYVSFGGDDGDGDDSF